MTENTHSIPEPFLSEKQKAGIMYVFEYVADDIAENGLVYQDAAVETVLDARRLEMLVPEVDWSNLRALKYEEQDRVVREEVLKYETYS